MHLYKINVELRWLIIVEVTLLHFSFVSAMFDVQPNDFSVLVF